MDSLIFYTEGPLINVHNIFLREMKSFGIFPKTHLSVIPPEQESSLDCLIAFPLVQSWEILEKFGEIGLLKSQFINPPYCNWWQIITNQVIQCS